MDVRFDAWAWFQKADLSASALQALKSSLTIVPKKYQQDDDDTPLELFTETATEIGVAREFVNQRWKGKYRLIPNTTEGDKSTWPGPLEFLATAKLRPQQIQAVDTVIDNFRTGQFGGLIKAAPGFGKTVLGCSLAARLQLPTLILVHKDFLMSQWEERIKQFLPNAKVGIAQQKRCEYQGNHIVIGMMHSVAKGLMPKAFYEWPGLILIDELHRIGARTWSPIPGLFRAKFRCGLTATPRRKDGAERVFQYHIGPILYTATEQRMKPSIKRVHSKFRLVKTPYFNPNLAKEGLLLRFLCANEPRNKLIVEQMIGAAKAGRKLLVMSKRIAHLERLDQMFQREWKHAGGPALSTGYYIGGMSEEARYQSSLAQIVFTTAQFSSEGLDIPALDTIFLTTPMGDVEQAVGRILRPFEGKKDPIVVDFRDPMVPLFEGYAKGRDRLYEKIT